TQRLASRLDGVGGTQCHSPAGDRVPADAPGSPLEPAAENGGTVFDAALVAHAERRHDGVRRRARRRAYRGARVRLPHAASRHAVQSLRETGAQPLRPRGDSEGRSGVAGSSGGPRRPLLPVAVVPRAVDQGSAAREARWQQRAARARAPVEGAAERARGDQPRSRADGCRHDRRAAGAAILVPRRSRPRSAAARRAKGDVMSKRARPEAKLDPATKAFLAGQQVVAEHPLFAPMLARVSVLRDKRSYCPAEGWAVVLENGSIHVHPTRRGESEEWAYILAHCLLHLGFSHFRIGEKSLDWNAACDVVVARFLADLKFGRCPLEMQVELHDVRADDEDHLFRRFREGTISDDLRALGTAGGRNGDLYWTPRPLNERAYEEWTRVFAAGLIASVSSAVRVAGGYDARLGASDAVLSAAERARRWFVNSYPLLGALAAAFTIVEDTAVCQRLGITVAAIDDEAKEIFVSSGAALSFDEAKFVLAHELLHAGLRHGARRRGRDPHLWNVACDYVINGWLVEMGLGAIPSFGGLHDAEVKGLSADAVYNRLVVDLRRNRKLATFRGIGACDMMEGTPDWWARTDAMSLDDFYRRALAQGLVYHHDQERGLLPAALIEEIRALDRPPMPWDVELAQWFDEHFSPLERVRTYARLRRRQSATPDI